MPRGVYFFIAPHEQRDWILSEMAEHGLWCVVRQPMRTPYRQVTKDEVAALDWTGEHPAELSICLGDPTVALPVLNSPECRVTNGLDIAHSHTVELRPSLLTAEKKVLEGALVMLSKHQLDYEGVDGAPTKELYNRLRKSLSRFWAKDSVVMRMIETLGPTVTHTHISRGALEMYRQGWGLRDSVGVPNTYETWDRDAVKKAKLSGRTIDL